MDATYTMIGADGLQYGPITLDQLKSWVTEGRVTAETKILRSDTNSWLPAANYTELGLMPPVPAAAPIAAGVPPFPGSRAQPQQQIFAGNPFLCQRVKRGASWFYLIAVFSLINYFLMANHGGFFLVGLGINLMTSNLVVTVVVSGIFALLGYFAGRAHAWSFVVGMLLYALDAVVFVMASDWLPLAFHAYGLYRIFMGLKAAIDLKRRS
jgi:GYF domain 2